ncbi:type IV pilus modification protein PilV [Endozoicomonas elysicola]|uniref:type IV pilus modification protein PilV n=1 Tax=Endozoicomonas elysicola TaxID=305900 RepID=UPI0003721F58|nr:type IV pilus modification protein PilV [Endozoicomonas elysicola]
MQLNNCHDVPFVPFSNAGQLPGAFATETQRHREKTKKYPFVPLSFWDEKNFEKKNRGVGLIEVLISLLIITIGILGMAGVHSSSLQYNQSSYVQSQATFLATDMLDRIQANSSLAKSSANYQVGLGDLEFSQCIESSYPTHCEAGNCTPQEMAFYDILQWKFQLACQIPGSQGAVTFVDSSDVRTYTIRLSFPDMGSRVPLSDVVLRGVL